MTRTLTATAALLTLSACTPSTDALTEVLPDERIEVNLPVDSFAATARGDLGEWSEFYVQTAETTENVNGLIANVLHLVDTLVHLRPSEVDRRGHRAVWGPYSDTLDPVETTLTVEYDPATDTHTWWFTTWPKGDEAAAVVVIAGEVDAGATRDTSTGRFVVDFTTLAELDPTTDVAGTFTSEYAIDFDAVTATAWFQDWVDLHAPQAPIDAGYAYSQTTGGSGTMDLAWQSDYGDDGTLDVYVLRSRWEADGQGRGDAVLVEEGEEVLAAASECWDDRFQLVWRADSWEGELGDASACVYGEASWPE